MARLTSTPTTVTVTSIPAWVPPPGHYADIMSVLASSVDPCPANNCVYSDTTNFPSIWTAYNGGAYAAALGDAGSMLFFGGGHYSYEGNCVVRLDLATRAWSLLTQPAPYGPKSPGWSNVDAENQVVGPWGAYPDGTPYPFHTNMGVDYLPSDAGGGPLGSFVFISHDQTGVACADICKLWRLDIAVALANPSKPSLAWSVAPGGSASIQNFWFGEGSQQRNGICYDSKRKGIWIVRYSGSGQLSFFSFLTGIETQVTKTGAGASWNMTGLDSCSLSYHATRDCLISRDSFNNLCVADLSRFSLSSPMSVPCAFANKSPNGPPAFTSTPVANFQDRLEWCSFDGNMYLLDWYTKTEARLYKLEAPSDVLSGQWQWSYEVLRARSGEPLQIMSIGAGRASAVSFEGRFRYVPAYKSFAWSDGASLRPQLGRPLAFL